MPEIRCPRCGRNNPDLLDVCQFCQAPLKPESVLHSGEKPTKKNTGELEPILPDWLKDVRQQARSAAEEQEAAQAAAQSRDRKDEPPDLLAGLASQAGSADEDVPDWLASLSPARKPAPSAPEPENDFFAQFNQPASTPQPARETPADEPTPPWTSSFDSQTPPERDELSEWFNRASGRTEEMAEPQEHEGETGWGSGVTSTPEEKPAEEEDLSWLHNLEAASRKTGELETPRLDAEPPLSPSSPGKDDLGWLDSLGGIEESSQPTPGPATPPDDLSWLDNLGGISEPGQPATPAGPQEDLGWLKDLGGAAEPAPFDAAPNQPIPPPQFAAEEDLDWLNKLGETSKPAQPSPEVEPAQPAEDLSWLNELGKSSPPAQPPAAEEDLSWLNALGAQAETETPTPSVSPRQTAPLHPQAPHAEEPDWLKSATAGPSMPAPGDLSTDWFSGAGQEKTPPTTPPFESDIPAVPPEPALSNQEVDSLFSVDMPDWLSKPEPGAAATAQPGEGLPAEGADSLAPVELPSWVQAMRPVEAVISEPAPSVSDQPAETEGPLAGLHGVIPMAPVGPARRPRPVSLTLQASTEQQASAVLLEQILGSETSPRTLAASSFVASQHWLRWALAGLFLLVLSVMILLGTQSIPVSASLPADVSGLSNAVMSIPSGAKILVVIDYEPSLAGEMEAVGGPVLDQLALLTQPNLSFLSTSPNGPALAERLLVNTKLNQTGVAVRNLGYLPGGSSGVLGFLEAPAQIAPLADVGAFSEYAALVVLTDHAESGRVWVEQLQSRKQIDPLLGNQPLLMVASAQAGPLLQPYLSSRQITGLVSGIAEAARYELVNNNRPGTIRSYWDAFGVGLMLSIVLIIVGSLWSLWTGIRARRAAAEQG